MHRSVGLLDSLILPGSRLLLLVLLLFDLHDAVAAADVAVAQLQPGGNAYMGNAQGCTVS